MVDRNIFSKLGLSEEDIDREVEAMFGKEEGELLQKFLEEKVDQSLPGTILEGTIVSQYGDDVIVEVGLKSEGVVDASEFDDPDEIEPGNQIEVLLEDNDATDGVVVLSKRKADRIRGWETIINTKNEGDVVIGKVIRRIKGGLLVDVGVPVFLPASQVDIRKPGDISRFIGKEVTCKILKIDIPGRNIVISRRKLIEEERQESKEKILAEIEAGQLRKGIVKNIADFGVFVDLGGLDGLLHISDLSWGRISHPSEVVELDQEIECIVIGVDKTNEKISLGLKQKTPSPWENVEENYPVGAKVVGKVVNVMNYGVFVRLEDGIEGLVHISEMSWTKRLNHPSEMLQEGDEIKVVVLSVNKAKQEISLGLKQMETNPWSVASQKYPVGTVVTVTVRSITNFGVFVEVEPGLDGMVHISDLSWTKKYSHPSEALQKDEKVKCVVLGVDVEKQHISLGIKQMTEDPWTEAIPKKYIAGHIIKGKVTKLTNFGAFVELEPDLEGLLHISELADHKVDKPRDVVKEGDDIEVKILKVDTEARKIGLSLRRARWAAEDEADSGKPEEEHKEPRKSPELETVLSDSDKEKLAQPDSETDKESKDEAAKTIDSEETEESETLEETNIEAEGDEDADADTLKSPEEVESEQSQADEGAKAEQPKDELGSNGKNQDDSGSKLETIDSEETEESETLEETNVEAEGDEDADTLKSPEEVESEQTQADEGAKAEQPKDELGSNGKNQDDSGSKLETIDSEETEESKTLEETNVEAEGDEDADTLKPSEEAKSEQSQAEKTAKDEAESEETKLELEQSQTKDAKEEEEAEQDAESAEQDAKPEEDEKE